MNQKRYNQFTNNIQDFIKQVIEQHTPLKITSQNGEDFIIISAEDWEQQQETLFVLQNSELMQQINDSLATHSQNKGYILNQEQLNENLNI
ncbi:type II toxin-antitoxin system Phd/YefM family antitoxin [Microcystis aeruginosa]|uniref:Antitoxin n=1 Tax=Microcystis aeruginosa PCC 9443 TaxID=1160281 RepID=I4G7P3_MICAE|nr:type II toxin-antitoxin system Phd/YefM family antitoxin [Microcystis aeruginosa]CCI03954.1 Antitoxin [Microcystis aeruginosa PCC 9443]